MHGPTGGPPRQEATVSTSTGYTPSTSTPSTSTPSTSTPSTSTPSTSPGSGSALPDPPGEPPARAGIRAWLRRRLTVLQQVPEAGMSTAEYAVGTVAACAFAAVLYRVVTGDSVVDGLTDLVDRALATLA